MATSVLLALVRGRFVCVVCVCVYVCVCVHPIQYYVDEGL
jgi:hypothetical protein